jgi:Bacterial EndoU nuclease
MIRLLKLQKSTFCLGLCLLLVYSVNCQTAEQMSARLTGLGLTALNNKFKALSFATQTIFINNFYATNNDILNVLKDPNKTAFISWKYWAEGVTEVMGKDGKMVKVDHLPGAPTATLTFDRFYYRTEDPSRIAHSEMGEFPLPSKPHLSLAPTKMNGGGHGQKNLDYLVALGWAFTITKTYPNGVRIGYIANHATDNKKGAPDSAGIPQSGQSWFPSSWTATDIQAAGNSILNKNRAAWDAIPADTTGTISGMYKGVKVILLKTSKQRYTDDIGSIYPDVNQ